MKLRLGSKHFTHQTILAALEPVCARAREKPVDWEVARVSGVKEDL